MPNAKRKVYTMPRLRQQNKGTDTGGLNAPALRLLPLCRCVLLCLRLLRGSVGCRSPPSDLDHSKIQIETEENIMDGHHPKRRKDKYNPYTIGTTEDGRHWLTFSDGQGNRHHFEISAAVFTLFDSFELDDLSYLNEVDRHYVDHNDITVSEFLYEFIEKYGEKKWVASTYDGNVGLLENYVHPYWGDKKLRSIRTKTVDDFYHFLLNEAEPATNMGKPKREHISPSTIHDIHKVLRCAFNQAKKWEYIAKNPFLDATLPEHKEAKRDALTPEQLQRVLDFTDRTDIYDLYVMHCAIQLAFACCMRGGEVGGTQWERFSRSDQVLYIDRVIDRVDKKLIEKLPKMDILFRFPNLYPGTRTVIVLKQPKTEGSIRTVYIPETVAKKLEKLREMQMKLKLELGDDGYMDYGLIICQANGRPIMTEHLNKRFKEVLIGLNDPTINVDNVVFHSLRHTSTGVKLRLSKGDLKAVQGDGGWNSPDMVTKRYAHILDEDRRRLADEMEQSFYKGKTEEAPVTAAPALDAEALASLLASNPELLKKALESVQLANNT